MLEFKNFKLKVNNRLLFQVDNISLSSGLIAIVGRNGAGKSTFFRSILGIHKEFEGTILLDDLHLNKADITARAKKIAIVNTKPVIFGNHTVEDVLYLGRLPYQNVFAARTNADELLVQRVMDQLGLVVFRKQLFSNLSDGEKQLVMIGRALVQDTPLILLDEPGAFLDVVNQFKIMEVLAEISKEENRLILFSTHQIESLQKYCDSILLITENKMNLIQKEADFTALIKMSFGIK